MVFFALFLCVIAMVFCVTGLFTFTVTMFQLLGLEFPWPGPLAFLPTGNRILLGWAQLSVAFGLLMASKQVYPLDR